MLFGSRLNKLATSIRRALSEYAVLGINPPFVADFIEKKYLTGGASSTFSSAINHARSTNAVMTDGYGPELVVNGGFDSDSDWTLNSGEAATFSVSAGKAQIQSGPSRGRISQALSTTVGTTYIVEATKSLGTAAVLQRGQVKIGTSSGGGDVVLNDVMSESVEFAFTATAATTYVTLQVEQGNVYMEFDNVSVREMPVLKWAPHNLVPYSEDFSNSYWTSPDVGLSTTADQIAAPNGTLTADKITNDTSSDKHAFQQSWGSDVVADTRFVFSFYAKDIDARYCYVGLRGAVNHHVFAEFDLTGETVSRTSSLGTWTINSTSIMDVGSGWYKCTLDFNAGSIISSSFYWLGISDGSANVAGSGNLVYTGAGEELYIWGAHLYRSDLGGMVDNPDRGDSYVPTTSSAKYLPRVGHHVYNGNAWVNAGLLAESEERTNLAPYSDLSDGFGDTRTTLTANQAVSPDGTENAAELTENTDTGNHFSRNNITVTASINYTLSAYVKQGSGSRSAILRTNNEGADDYVVFDFTTESITETGSGASNATSQSVGNGWYRIAFTYTQSSDTSSGVAIALSNSATPGTSLPSYTGDGSSSVYFYGLQFEKGASNTSVYTPSSLIPNYGTSAGVTRAAETFTIPSANLPWSQSYGTEVSASSWTGSGWDTFTSTGDDFSANKSTAGGTDHAYSNTAVTVVNGQSVKIDVDFDTGTNTQAVIALSSTTNARSNTVTVDPSAGGTKSVTVTATQSGTFSISVRTTQTGTINVTGARAAVVTNDPVSIAMDGRMTRESVSNSVTAMPVRWSEDGNNQIRIWHDSSIGNGVRWDFDQEANNVIDQVSSGYINPFGILVPFDIASRHGSTFINGAIDGVALTANTTPTALPDLSATDLNLAYDYMGTVSEFRIWDKDIGDAGLVEATEPSLEPSLSLTFEGVGTNSFVVNDWSE